MCREAWCVHKFKAVEAVCRGWNRPRDVLVRASTKQTRTGLGMCTYHKQMEQTMVTTPSNEYETVALPD